ncbi:hypothetical protein DRP04_03340 [Archaeoglobales archaeon]|nr:MAG: hypothetical protein DRP04_03340 [Archaeoglobales archaeon]
MAEEAKKKGKVRVVGYVSPRIKEMIQQFVEEGIYGSESDFVSEAVVKLAYEIQMTRERKVIQLE